MSRLIDADDLLEAIKNKYGANGGGIIDLIANAPTVQREGWVSIDRTLTKNMIRALETVTEAYHHSSSPFHNPIHRDAVLAIRELKAMIQAAPTDKE